MKVLAEIAPADLPEGWPMRRVRDVATLINGFPFKSEDFDSSGEVPLVRIRDLTASDFELFVPKSAVPDESLMRNGDLAIGMDGDFNSVLWTRGPAALNQRVCILRPRRGTDIRFLGYVLPSVLQIINDLTYSTTVKHLSGSDVLQQLIPFPDFELQQRICQFLDCETAQIDDLIGKQERLIELLAEKRQAIITHAVTKGLDPTAPTKPSGIPSLGEIPAHWMECRLKNVTQIRYGLGQPPREVEGGVPVIRATNVRSGRVSEENLMFADPEDIPEGRDAYLRLGEIIVVRSGANTADSTIIREEYAGCLAGYDMVVRPTACEPEFIAWALLSDYVRANQLVLASSRAAQPHLNAAELGEAAIVLPPLEEQWGVVSHLNRLTKQVDAVISRSNATISLLRERRSALISAAVTGKIDVREGVA